MAEVHLTNLKKIYGKNVVAVKDLNLVVHDKEFLVLLGPSGCGKTTTMRMIAGLEEVTEGTILIGDRDITDLPPRKRNVSMVFQNYAVWPHMTVYENIAYPLRLKKMPKQEIDKVVIDVAEMTSIGELLERYPTQLSGGQQQRVAVTRAIAVYPEVFLMDEPLSNLDAKLRVSMRTELKAIHAKTEATTIFVTHDQSEAMSVADRIVIMKDGEIEQMGTPEEVYDKSANMFVADFIGTPPTNFFDSEIRQTNGSLHLINPSFDLSLDSEYTKWFQDYGKRDVIIGVRPENIIVVNESEALFSVDVLVVEPQGSHQVVTFDFGKKMVKIVAPTHPPISPGDRIHVNFNQRSLRFFDPQTTQAIYRAESS